MSLLNLPALLETKVIFNKKQQPPNNLLISLTVLMNWVFNAYYLDRYLKIYDCTALYKKKLICKKTLDFDLEYTDSCN